MTRRVNAESLALIKQWEGLRLETYKDVGGVLTIGYGSTSDVEPGMKITRAQAHRRLVKDLATAEGAVDSLVKVDLTPNQFGALVSFVFNVGVGAFSKSTLLRKLNAGDYASVPSELARWNKVKGKTVAGLANRRAAEAGLWSRGEFVASNTVEPVPERAPIGKGDVTAGAIGAGAAGKVVDAISEHSDTISTVSWLLSGQGVIAIVAGVALLGCVGWLAYSYWKRSK